MALHMGLVGQRHAVGCLGPEPGSRPQGLSHGLVLCLACGSCACPIPKRGSRISTRCFLLGLR